MRLINNMEVGAVHLIKDLVDYKEDGLNRMVLVDREDLNIFIFAMDEGFELKTHTTNGDGLLQCLEGRAKVIIDGEEFMVAKDQSILLGKDIPHSVEAVERFKMLLTIVK